MKTLVAIRHVSFEHLGILEPLLVRNGYKIYYYDVGVHELWTIDNKNIDLLVILGAPIGAFDDESYPFLEQELQIIQQRLEMKKPILGICLGAQLIARALGASVKPMLHKEIGFFPVKLSDAGRESVLTFLGNDLPVLHWHGDQFDIPEGATNLAYTDTCAHQAFTIGNYALALQFHIEVDSQYIEQWLIGHSLELHLAKIKPTIIREQAAVSTKDVQAAATLLIQTWLDGFDQF